MSVPSPQNTDEMGEIGQDEGGERQNNVLY